MTNRTFLLISSAVILAMLASAGLYVMLCNRHMMQLSREHTPIIADAQAVMNGILFYAEEHNDRLPPSQGWERALSRYIPSDCQRRQIISDFEFNTELGGKPVKSVEGRDDLYVLRWRHKFSDGRELVVHPVSFWDIVGPGDPLYVR